MSDTPLRALLDETLRLPASAIAYRMGAALATAFPVRTVLETDDGDFDVWRFRRDGHCALEWHDGFEQNDGILTIATTNHAERLDPAIVDRPSRFDRKYHFGLPAQRERAARRAARAAVRADAHRGAARSGRYAAPRRPRRGYGE